MYGRILVPLDGSAAAEAVLSVVIRLFRGKPSFVVLATIEEPGPLDPGPGFQVESIQFALEYLKERAAALGEHGIRAKVVARAGAVAETLLEVAQEEEVELIAMATHGRTASRESPFGGVAERLLGSSRVPILAMSSFAPILSGTGASEGMAPAFHSILVSTSASPASRTIVPVAVEFARAVGARILLLGTLPASGGDEEAARKQVEKTLVQMKREAELREVPVETILERGDPIPTLLEVARRRKADLIALTTEEGSELREKSIGRVTQAVLKTAGVPLLVSRGVRPRLRRSRKASIH